ncbi:MAG: metal-dependent hydrolase [Thermoguttaceae bacterium]|nr:metal-dependent hydrolase [Thermoguttaceae bacterium]
MKDIPYKSLKFKNYTIEGFSRAAIQTFWHIPEFHLGFDLGAQPWDFMGTPNWFISHTHLDHLAMLPNYVARRRMMKMPPPVVYLPEKFVDLVARLLNVWMRLDYGNFPCELVGLKSGDSVELSKELVVEAFETEHRVDSLGYVVYSRRKKLKQEFLDLPGEEIKRLKDAGADITYEIKTPKIAYLGDSNCLGLDKNPIFYEAETLIMEMTFVEQRHLSDKIHKFGHIHLNDVVARQNRFHNELIIASHFTARSVTDAILNSVREKLPDMLGGRLKLWG